MLFCKLLGIIETYRLENEINESRGDFIDDFVFGLDSYYRNDYSNAAAYLKSSLEKFKNIRTIVNANDHNIEKILKNIPEAAELLSNIQTSSVKGKSLKLADPDSFNTLINTFYDYCFSSAGLDQSPKSVVKKTIDNEKAIEKAVLKGFYGKTTEKTQENTRPAKVRKARSLNELKKALETIKPKIEKIINNTEAKFEEFIDQIDSAQDIDRIIDKSCVPMKELLDKALNENREEIEEFGTIYEEYNELLDEQTELDTTLQISVSKEVYNRLKHSVKGRYLEYKQEKNQYYVIFDHYSYIPQNTTGNRSSRNGLALLFIFLRSTYYDNLKDYIRIDDIEKSRFGDDLKEELVEYIYGDTLDPQNIGAVHYPSFLKINKNMKNLPFSKTFNVQNILKKFKYFLFQKELFYTRSKDVLDQQLVNDMMCFLQISNPQQYEKNFKLRYGVTSALVSGFILFQLLFNYFGCGSNRGQAPVYRSTPESVDRELNGQKEPPKKIVEPPKKENPPPKHKERPARIEGTEKKTSGGTKKPDTIQTQDDSTRSSRFNTWEIK